MKYFIYLSWTVKKKRNTETTATIARRTSFLPPVGYFLVINNPIIVKIELFYVPCIQLDASTLYPWNDLIKYYKNNFKRGFFHVQDR